MTNPNLLPHNAAYEALAYEFERTPEEIEAAARAFGNDFDSLANALNYTQDPFDDE